MVIKMNLMTRFTGALLALSSLSVTAEEVKYDYYLPSKWNTVTWGVYSAEYAPQVKVKSGDIVKIDIANPHGSNRSNPQKFFIDNKIPLDLPVVQDILEVQEKTPMHPTGLRGALLTGPVYVEGAEAGG